jgi:hypothetical protein
LKSACRGNVKAKRDLFEINKSEDFLVTPRNSMKKDAMFATPTWKSFLVASISIEKVEKGSEYINSPASARTYVGCENLDDESDTCSISSNPSVFSSMSEARSRDLSDVDVCPKDMRISSFSEDPSIVSTSATKCLSFDAGRWSVDAEDEACMRMVSAPAPSQKSVAEMEQAERICAA